LPWKEERLLPGRTTILCLNRFLVNCQRPPGVSFGPTPISQGDECRLVTQVNVLGKLEDDPQLLESVSEGETMRVEVLDGE
jgi:hypothetical protein